MEDKIDSDFLGQEHLGRAEYLVGYLEEAEKEALDRETGLARKSRFRTKKVPEGKWAQRRLFKKPPSGSIINS